MEGVLYHLFDHSLLCTTLYIKIKLGLMRDFFSSGELSQREGMLALPWNLLWVVDLTRFSFKAIASVLNLYFSKMPKN